MGSFLTSWIILIAYMGDILKILSRSDMIWLRKERRDLEDVDGS